MSENKNASIPPRKQPNSRHCFVCGLENKAGLRLSFYEDPSGMVYSDVLVPDQYQGYPDVVHGGILASMLDEIAGRAAMYKKPHHFMFTGRMEVRYRKPVPTGKMFRLTGRIVQEKSRTAVAESKIELPDGTIGAEAEVTLVRIPEFQIDQTDLEALGWQVYPD
jgi:uncharacterized protein (TIGR00369 family)